MLMKSARQVREGLAELIRLANDAASSTADLRAVLAECKTFGGQLAVLQADAAAVVAARERHGDSGAGVLARTAGLSKRDAAAQAKTAERLQSMPAVREAVESGEISVANAQALAKACERTSAGEVERDALLLEKAAELWPEQFAREAGRWVAQQQHDDGEDQYRRQRALRRLSIWDGEDGMVHLRGELDPVTGAKMRKRLLEEAERLRREDVNNPGGEKRSFNQRMADALDTLTSNRHNAGGAGRPLADIAIVQHLDAAGTKAFAEIVGGGTIPQSVLEEHMSNAKITGVVFSDKGVPLWQSYTKRTATKAQMTALRAMYGGCGGCDAHFALCQAHHIRPVSQGGRTDIDNMMLLCWGCHQKVHHHDWRVVPSGDLYTIEPPERIRYGPAHAPDPEPNRRAGRTRPPRRSASPGGDKPPRRGEPARSRSNRAAQEQSRPDRDGPADDSNPAVRTRRPAKQSRKSPQSDVCGALHERHEPLFTLT